MLKELENLPGVCGIENDVRDFLKKELEPVCASIQIDKMGNLHATTKGDGPRFLLITYMDEPGVIVTKITPDGYLCFAPVGRIQPSFLVSKRVFFGERPGIIALKAIHLTTKKERETPVKASELFIDIGAGSREEAEKFIQIGDYGVPDIPYTNLQGAYFKGRGIAGRIGCFVAAEILKQHPNANIHAIFAVQREIGHRGIQGLSQETDADFCVILDGIEAKAYHNAKEPLPEAGKGVVLLRRTESGSIPGTSYSFAKALAKEEGVAMQYFDASEKGPEALLIKQGKIKEYLSLSIPVRYPKSFAPVANQQDVNAMLSLIAKFIQKQGGRGSVC